MPFERCGCVVALEQAVAVAVTSYLWWDTVLFVVPTLPQWAIVPGAQLFHGAIGALRWQIICYSALKGVMS